MAFTRPVVGADISAADFGQPVYDQMQPTGWQPLPFSNGWAAVATTPAVNRIGYIVHMRGAAAGALVTAGTTIATIPVGFRPTANIQLSTTVYYSSWLPVELDIYYNTGQIQLGSGFPAGASYLTLEATWFTV